MGDLEAGREHIDKGLKIKTDAGLPYFFSGHLVLLGTIHLEDNDLSKAQDCVEEALRLSLKNGEKDAEGHSKLLLGKILEKEKTSGNKPEEYILEGISILNELKMRPGSARGYLFLGELYADRRREEKALKNLKTAEGMFKEMGMDYWLKKTREVLGRL
jgi:tetratricopeptide (TPR) repeat protein